MRLHLICLSLLILPLTACLRDETISAYAPGLWVLERQNGNPADTGVTLEIVQRGQISGHAQCNGYNAAQFAPYPWIDLGEIETTGLTCPVLESEMTYLALLASMTLAEGSGPILILTNDAGETLEYVAYQP